MKNLSCVTLSPRPESRGDLPPEVSYINHVSTFNNSAELHRQRLASLEAIQTPYWVWCDNDDGWRWPNDISLDNRVTYGYELKREVLGTINSVVEPSPWSANLHMAQPRMMHKAICSTRETKLLLPLLPQGEYYTEHMVYWILANACGTRYLPQVTTEWNVKTSGMHVLAERSIVNTCIWLLTNRYKILKEFASALQAAD